MPWIRPLRVRIRISEAAHHCVKAKKRPNADIEEGHKSTRLCHLGNIAYRTGRTLRFDPRNETIEGDAEASKLLGREYRKPFVMPEKV